MERLSVMRLRLDKEGEKRQRSCLYLSDISHKIQTTIYVLVLIIYLF